jgi:hypothetical protein
MQMVEVLDPGDKGESKDVLVTIEETPLNWLLFGGCELAISWHSGDLERLNRACLRFGERIADRIRQLRTNH